MLETLTSWSANHPWVAATRRPASLVAGLLASIFLVMVALSLVAPLLRTIIPARSTLVARIEERRTPTPFPSRRLLLEANGDFAAGLNRWFDDRMGLRDLFIRAKNQIDYTLFHTSRKVYVGSDGWLFQRGETIQNPTAAQLSAIEDRFLALARRLQDRGVHLIVVGYPRKSSVYPEMAPPEMPLVPAGGTYDRLRQFLATRPELNFVDAQEIIQREKSLTTEHVYSQQDMHATQIGQLPVVKAIIARIADIEGRPEIRWNENFKLAHAYRQAGFGSEGRFLSLLFPPAGESYAYFDGYYGIGQKEADGQWFLPDPHVLDRADDGVGRPFDWEFRSSPELCPQRLPGMVVFGNSFSDAYWALGLHRYFCSIRRARDPISRFKPFYDTMPADTKYFIFEYYEPWLWGEPPPLN
jgi:alginate O-acetyltransferase complex protein AlgJ